MYSDKDKILNDHEELELTEFGDFRIKEEYTKNYKIIDFHCHLYDGIKSFLPLIFRKPIDNLNLSFFDLSCYPISRKYFALNSVLFTEYPTSKLGLLKTGFEISGLGGFVTAIRAARPNRLIRDMELNGIDKSLVLQLNTPSISCMETMKEIVKENEKLMTFGSIHPLDREIDKKVELNINSGVLGWKIAPHVNGDNIDSENSIKLLKALHNTGMPIISCSGLAFPEDRLNVVPKSLRKSIETQNIKRFNRVLEEVPGIKLIFAHAGIYQVKELIELMKKYPHTYADISTQPSDNIRLLINELGSKRLLFGTDYPAFNQAFSILSVLKATVEEDARQNIFSKNAERLLNI